MSETAAPRVILACDFHLRYDSRLAGGLSRAGAEVTLVTRDHDGEFGNEPGAALRFVGEAIGPDVKLRRVSGRVRTRAGWRQLPQIRRELRRQRPAILHFQQSVGNDPRILLATGVPRRRFALTIHDPVIHPGEDGSRLAGLSDRGLIKNAGLIFVHGEALGEELREISSPRAPIVVVPHGIHVGDALPLPQQPSILFFGRMSYYKGLDVLLDAMPAIWAEQPETTLTVAGAGEIAAHPVLDDPRVTVRRGHLPDAVVPDLFGAATVVALPYRQASQSGVGSLAKANGRGMIVTNVGGLPELVADGSGLAVEPEQPGELAAAVLEVISDPAVAARLGKKASEGAARTASWDVVAERTLAAYEEYLG